MIEIENINDDNQIYFETMIEENFKDHIDYEVEKYTKEVYNLDNKIVRYNIFDKNYERHFIVMLLDGLGRTIISIFDNNGKESYSLKLYEYSKLVTNKEWLIDANKIEYMIERFLDNQKGE